MLKASDLLPFGITHSAVTSVVNTFSYSDEFSEGFHFLHSLPYCWSIYLNEMEHLVLKVIEFHSNSSWSSVFESIVFEKKTFWRIKKYIDNKNLRRILHLYWNQRAKVRIKGKILWELEIWWGMWYRRILSPVQFNVYSENTFKLSRTPLTSHILFNSYGIKINVKEI